MRLITLLLASLALWGCSTVQTATKPVDMTGAAKSAFAARAAYAGLLMVAVEYNRRPRCGQPTSPVLCSEQRIVDQLRQASAAADAATQAGETAVRNLGSSPLALTVAVTAAEKSIEAFKAITDVYVK